MKVTRYFQSCLLIEENGVRILIDPSGQDKDIEKFGKLDAVLYTHEHSDHFDPEMATIFVEQGVAPVYANASTAKQIEASKTEVSDGQEFDIKGVKIKAYELPHCLMVDGSQGPQNTGYLISQKLFHPGDGKELNGISVDNLAMPLAGPDISPHDGFTFAKQVNAKQVIPIHYDYLGGNPDFFAMMTEKHGIKTLGLKNGETVEL
jgi:L-ascorbate metabolism protein UlaG (beta-lactamase superfamily)